MDGFEIPAPQGKDGCLADGYTLAAPLLENPCVLQALSLGWLISYFDDSSSNAWEGWVFASVVVLAGLLFR